MLQVSVLRDTVQTPASEVKFDGSRLALDSPYPSSKQSEILLVGFDEAANEDPRRWSRWRRRYVVILVSFIVAFTMLASAAHSAFAHAVLAEFNMSKAVVHTLVDQFSVCFCIGPLLWGPLSEKYGRKPILLICFACFTLVEVGVALSRNVASIAILRFITGFFASASLPVSAAIITDICETQARERALALYVLPMVTPSIGPLFRILVLKIGLDWQGTSWVIVVMGGICTILIVFTLKETCRPNILRSHVRRLRRQTNDGRYRAATEVVRAEPGSQAIQCFCHTLATPFLLFLREPLLIACSVYLALVTDCSHILFEASAFTFRSDQPGLSYLFGSTNLFVMLGNIIALATYFVATLRHRSSLEYTAHTDSPEQRLTLAIWSSPFFAISFLWFGGTLEPGIDGFVPLASGVVLGISSFWLTLVIVNYIIDVYENAAASAIACYAVVSNIFVAVFPLFSDRMFAVLSPRWASIIAGGVAVVLIHFPVVLKRYGPALRASSRYVQ